MRTTCPHCNSVLTRPTVAELREIGDTAMDRARAGRAWLESGAHPTSPEYRIQRLAAFMGFVENRPITHYEAEQMLREEPVC